MSELAIYQKWIPSVYQPSNDTEAVDVRRGMVAIPEVMTGLSRIEAEIFRASAARLISHIDDRLLIENAAKIFKVIADDIGYTIPNNLEWSYRQTRILELLKKYYGDLTLSEVRLAFELVANGMLDNYLPRNAQGNPDRNHYQKFNADYVSRVINAYKKKRKEVVAKAYSLVPKKRQEINVPLFDVSYIYKAILRYKYTGILSFDRFGDELVLLQILTASGYIEDDRINEDDKMRAYMYYIKHLSNRLMAEYVRSTGPDAIELKDWSLLEKNKRVLRNTLDYIIRQEYDLRSILRFVYQ